MAGCILRSVNESEEDNILSRAGPATMPATNVNAAMIKPIRPQRLSTSLNAMDPPPLASVDRSLRDDAADANRLKHKIKGTPDADA